MASFKFIHFYCIFKKRRSLILLPSLWVHVPGMRLTCIVSHQFRGLFSCKYDIKSIFWVVFRITPSISFRIGVFVFSYTYKISFGAYIFTNMEVFIIYFNVYSKLCIIFQTVDILNNKILFFSKKNSDPSTKLRIWKNTYKCSIPIKIVYVSKL